MHNDGLLMVLFIMLIFFGFPDDGSNEKHDIVDSKKVTVEQSNAEKEVLINHKWPDGRRRIIREGDVHTVNLQINLMHGGYVGTGPAIERIRATDSFSYPNEYMTGNNGLIMNASINEYRVQFNSIFGEKYNCYIFTRRMIDTAIIRNEKGQGQLYLAKVEWQDDKTLLVVLNLTTAYELKQLDRALFKEKAL